MRREGARRQGKLQKVLRQSFRTVARLTSGGASMGQRPSRNLPPIRASTQSAAAFAADLPPLRFHRHHGENIRLERGGFRAKRVESFCKGVCFTDRPINVGERVCIRVAELSTRWKGVLRVGFAAHNPASLGELPKYACPDLTKREGFWAKALSDRVTEAGANIHFYVTAGGDVHFGMDGEDVGVFFSGVDTRQTLWAMVDLYGNCTAIDLVDMRRGLNNYSNHGQPQFISAETAAAIRRHHLQPNHVYHLQQQQQQQQFSMEQLHDGISTLSIRPLAVDHPPPPPYVPPQEPLPAAAAPVPRASPPQYCPPNPVVVAPTPSHPGGRPDPSLRFNRDVPFRPLSFHFCSGKHARLNATSDEARRHDEEFAQGYVFTAAPIALGERMVVQVLATDDSFSGSLAFGLTNCDPSSIDTHELPEDSDLLLDRGEYWVCSKDVGAYPAPGDELSFTVRRDGAVEFSKNGGAPSVFAHVDASLPRLWAFWDVYGNTSKIRLVGATSQPVEQLVEPAAAADVGGGAAVTQQRPDETFSSANTGPTECIVCLERPVDCVIYSCGHMCMCHECAVRQWRGRGGGFCPICRDVIRDVIKTFRS